MSLQKEIFCPNCHSYSITEITSVIIPLPSSVQPSENIKRIVWINDKPFEFYTCDKCDIIFKHEVP